MAAGSGKIHSARLFLSSRSHGSAWRPAAIHCSPGSSRKEVANDLDTALLRHIYALIVRTEVAVVATSLTGVAGAAWPVPAL